jgi:PAS domain S-box-containing protein
MPRQDSYRALKRTLTALRAEARRAASRSRDASLEELLPWAVTRDDAILFTDNTGRYIAANTKGLRLTGFTLKELRKKHVWDLTDHSTQTEFDSLWRAFLVTGAQRGEYRLRRRSGRTTDVVYVAGAHVLKNVHASVIRPVDRKSDRPPRSRKSSTRAV